MALADELALRSRPRASGCTVCKFLSAMDPKTRAEVEDAYADDRVSLVTLHGYLRETYELVVPQYFAGITTWRRHFQGHVG